MTSRFHLSQYNVAKARAPLENHSMRGFVEALRPMNDLADADPDFVWRLKTDDGDSTSIRPYPGDPSILVTLSVWRSLEGFARFAYRGPHAGLLREREAWFEPATAPGLVLWWVPAGQLPSIDEAVDRLETLRRLGPTPEAFTLRNPFPAPDSAREAADLESRI